eukprot:781094-Pelagomonas_calceolata.AAC.7
MSRNASPHSSSEDVACNKLRTPPSNASSLPSTHSLGRGFQGVCQPVQTLIQPLSPCGHSTLHVPLASLDLGKP